MDNSDLEKRLARIELRVDKLERGARMDDVIGPCNKPPAPSPNKCKPAPVDGWLTVTSDFETAPRPEAEVETAIQFANRWRLASSTHHNVVGGLREWEEAIRVDERRKTIEENGPTFDALNAKLEAAERRASRAQAMLDEQYILRQEAESGRIDAEQDRDAANAKLAAAMKVVEAVRLFRYPEIGKPRAVFGRDLNEVIHAFDAATAPQRSSQDSTESK